MCVRENEVRTGEIWEVFRSSHVSAGASILMEFIFGFRTGGRGETFSFHHLRLKNT